MTILHSFNVQLVSRVVSYYYLFSKEETRMADLALWVQGRRLKTYSVYQKVGLPLRLPPDAVPKLKDQKS